MKTHKIYIGAVALAATLLCLAGISNPGQLTQYFFGGITNAPLSTALNDVPFMTNANLVALSNTLYTTANNASGTVYSTWNSGSNVLATATANASNAMVNASNTLYTAANNASNVLATATLNASNAFVAADTALSNTLYTTANNASNTIRGVITTQLGSMVLTMPGSSNQVRAIIGNNTQQWYTITYAP